MKRRQFLQIAGYVSIFPLARLNTTDETLNKTLDKYRPVYFLDTTYVDEIKSRIHKDFVIKVFNQKYSIEPLFYCYSIDYPNVILTPLNKMELNNNTINYICEACENSLYPNSIRTLVLTEPMIIKNKKYIFAGLIVDKQQTGDGYIVCQSIKNKYWRHYKNVPN